MTAKADFNADEWTTITDAPLMAAMRVVSAERGGTIRESLAVGRAYAEARGHQGDSTLLDAIVATPPTPDPSRFKAGTDLSIAATERLREAVAVVEAKASPEEVDAYKRFVVTVAEAVAGANKEGGFAGIGGKAVSDNERAALDEIRSTLGLTEV
jgi:polyisoprenoid-binding protein YceI